VRGGNPSCCDNIEALKVEACMLEEPREICMYVCYSDAIAPLCCCNRVQHRQHMSRESAIAAGPLL